jgi:hypothetical protein
MVFFDQLDAYLSWESLEGGPYLKIGNLGNDSEGIQYPQRYSQREFDEIRDQLKEILVNIINDYVSIKVCTDKNRILYRDLVVDKDNLEVRLVKEYLKAGHKPPNYLLCYRYKQGLTSKYYTGKLAHKGVNAKELRLLLFKDKPVYLKIVDEIEESEIVNSIVFLPNILDNFLSTLKFEIYKVDTKLR